MGLTPPQATVTLNGAISGDTVGGTLPDAVEVQPESLTDAHIATNAAVQRTKLEALETRHLVGGGGEPAFETGWSNFDATYVSAGFWLDEASGLLHIEGAVKAPAGTAVTLFTLPSGYRPPKDMGFLTFGFNGTPAFQTAVITVFDTGPVTVDTVPGNGWVVLHLNLPPIRV